MVVGEWIEESERESEVKETRKRSGREVEEGGRHK
jgi:hypothetical protein